MSAISRVIDRALAHEEINGGNICPTYLHRWRLLRLGSVAVYVHKFVGPDWSTDLHDHPKRFITLGLWGEYVEHGPCLYDDHACPGAHMRLWRAPWLRTFPASHAHRITGPTPERPCWTLVLTGPTVRAWGFLTPRGWVPWRQYVRSDRAYTARSCQ